MVLRESKNGPASDSGTFANESIIDEGLFQKS